MFCTKCGSEIPDDSIFCGSCGAKVEPIQPIESFMDSSSIESSIEAPAASTVAPGSAAPDPVAPNGSAAPLVVDGFDSVQAQHETSVPQAFNAAPQADSNADKKLSPKRKKLVAIGGGVVAVVVVVLVLVVGNLLASSGNVAVDSFSDPVVQFVISDAADSDKDGIITVEEAQVVESLSFDGATTVSNLAVFPNLNSVTLKGDSLTSASLADCKKLTSITASDCPNLTELELADDPELKKVDISGSPIESLDLAGDTSLESIECDDSVKLLNLDSTSLHEYWVIDRFQSDPSITPSEYTYDIQATYDDEGLLTKLVSTTKYGTITFSYAYDNAGTLSKVTANMGSDTYTFSMTYNEEGLLSQSTWDSLPADAAMGSYYERSLFTYNSAGLPTNFKHEVNQGGATQKEIAYGSKNELTSMTDIDEGSGDVYHISNDEAGRISEIELVDYSSQPEKWKITYDASGNIQEFSYNSDLYSFTQTMQYDENGRIVSATRDADFLEGQVPDYVYASVSSADFEYDDNGNLTKMTPTRSGPGTVEGYSVSYKRILTTNDKMPISNFIDLSNPLSPLINEQFWSSERYLYIGILAWQKSMQNVMAKLPSARKE